MPRSALRGVHPAGILFLTLLEMRLLWATTRVWALVCLPLYLKITIGRDITYNTAVEVSILSSLLAIAAYAVSTVLCPKTQLAH